MLPGTAAEVAAGGVALVLDPALAPREDRPARMIVPRGGSLAIRRATHGLRQPATINGVPVPTAWLNADEKCRVLSRTHAHLRCRRRRNSSSDVLLLYDGSPHELTKSVNGSTVDGVPVPLGGHMEVHVGSVIIFGGQDVSSEEAFKYRVECCTSADALPASPSQPHALHSAARERLPVGSATAPSPKRRRLIEPGRRLPALRPLPRGPMLPAGLPFAHLREQLTQSRAAAALGDTLEEAAPAAAAPSASQAPAAAPVPAARGKGRKRAAAAPAVAAATIPSRASPVEVTGASGRLRLPPSAVLHLASMCAERERDDEGEEERHEEGGEREHGGRAAIGDDDADAMVGSSRRLLDASTASGTVLCANSSTCNE